MSTKTYGGFKSRKPKQDARKQFASRLGISKREATEFREQIEDILGKNISYRMISTAINKLSEDVDVLNAQGSIAEIILELFSDSLKRTKKSKRKIGAVEERLQPLLNSSDVSVKDARAFVKAVCSNSKNISKNEIIPAIRRLRRRGLPINPVAVANEINDVRKRRLPDPKEISIPMGGHPKGRKPRG